MKRFGALLVLAATVVFWARASQASPVQGVLGKYDKVGGGGTYTEKITFKGGQRACVVVAGDHEPIVPVSLEIYDKNGLVTKDDHDPSNDTGEKGRLGNDICAAIWYPPRDAEYTIVIKNFGG